MSSDALDSAQHAVSELLYRAILLVWEQMMACDTELREANRNIAKAVVSYCDTFIVASFVLRLVLLPLFSTFVGVLDSVELRGTTEYVLMEFTVLSLLTIYSNTGLSSELEE